MTQRKIDVLLLDLSGPVCQLDSLMAKFVMFTHFGGLPIYPFGLACPLDTDFNLFTHLTHSDKLVISTHLDHFSI